MKWLVIAIFLWAAPAWADFDAGVAAYERGDYTAAFGEWKPLAAAGDPRAQHRLGLLYVSGLGTGKDPGLALKWLRKAAGQGYAAAQEVMGVIYELGKLGLAKDSARAVKLYRLAADQGYAQAQYSLGSVYNARAAAKVWKSRIYPKEDYSRAAKWYRLAAKQGHAKAQYALGNAYFAGRGVVQDYGPGLKWLRKAAGQGHAQAQFDLAGIYFAGWHVTKDVAQAYSWAMSSAALGYVKGIKLRDYIASKITPVQMAKAKRLALYRRKK